MSCADLCITHYFDGGSNAFYAERIVTAARRAHQCCECNEEIPRGATYQRANGKIEGRIFSVATCRVCADVRRAFVCHAWIFGELWESVAAEMFPAWRRLGPWDCLAKLTLQESVDECVRRFTEYVNDWEPIDPPRAAAKEGE